MRGFFDIKQKFTSNFVEVGEHFSYCINIKNISNNIIFDLLYREQFNNNLRVISANIDGKEIEYKIDNNIILFKIDKINVKETKAILITLEVLDYIVKNEFNSFGMIEGKTKVKDSIEKVEQDIKNIELFVVYHKLVLTMISSLNEAVKDDIIDIMIIAENMGNIDIQNVLVRDVLKAGLKFIENSVEIDDYINKEDDPNNGINIGGLKIGELKIIKFKVKVVSDTYEKFITNKAIARYLYNNIDEELSKIGVAVSNIEKIFIQAENVEVLVEVDDEVSLNSEVLYKIFISNIGTLDLYNLFFRKEIGEGFEFIKNSLRINGDLIELESLDEGIFLGNLKRYDKLQLVFKLKYLGGIDRNFIENTFILDKDYKLKDKYILKGGSVSKSIKHFINISSFNQVIFEGNIVLGKNNLPIKEVNNIKCDLDIKDYYCIDTFYGQSVDNQINTGKKLILSGVLKSDLEYISKNEDGSVHFINYEHIFSSYIVLPEHYKREYNLYIKGKIEDCIYTIESEEKVKIIAVILVIAKII